MVSHDKVEDCSELKEHPSSSSSANLSDDKSSIDSNNATSVLDISTSRKTLLNTFDTSSSGRLHHLSKVVPSRLQILKLTSATTGGLRSPSAKFKQIA
ncbi:hypothetical protein LINGRAHAP2_LOCUS17245 [Linum grandiflorum]